MHTSIALAAILVAGQVGFDRAPEPANSARLRHCVVSIIDQVQVPAEEPGVIISVIAKEGRRVKMGDIVAHINDTEALMRLKAADLERSAAMKEAENDVNVRAAQAAKDVAEAEKNESIAINRDLPGSIPATQLRRELLTLERAILQIEVARFEQSLALSKAHVNGVQVEAANAEVKRRKVDAPQDGEVIQVYRHVGEWVQPGDPIMRIVRMDRLRVEGFVNAKEHSPFEIAGKKVTVTVKLARGVTKDVEGRIDFVSPVVEASGEYRVWAEVENTTANGFWMLRPGLSAEILIHKNSDTQYRPSLPQPAPAVIPAVPNVPSPVFDSPVPGQ
jgi:multidrug efflux pump subunit AcrA (membrane-fusion protein)